MALRPRVIPSNIREDIKLGGILPLDGLPWIVGSFLLGVLIAFVSSLNIIIKIFLVFVPPIALLLIFVFDAYNRLIRWTDFKFSEKRISNLSDLLNIQALDTICEIKNKLFKVFLESNVDPWEVCPDSIKEQRANIFAEEIFSALKENANVDIYAISAPESTKQLDERYAKLNSYPHGLRELEDARIAVHYQISRKASSTKYITSVGMKNKDDVSDTAGIFEENAEMIGGDIVKDLVNNHLTPGAKVSRGKNINPN